ncbi:hypothetical protein H6F73_12080 [Microcoleus sp. FACHB-68]|nr:hypothetical protein [Microcoleus sp. FACHB-68]
MGGKDAGTKPPSTPLQGIIPTDCEAISLSLPQQPAFKIKGNVKFLDYFYEASIHQLCRPIST